MNRILKAGVYGALGCALGYAAAVAGAGRVTDNYVSSVPAPTENRVRSKKEMDRVAKSGTVIYQWSGPSGKTYFGDQPPKDAKNIQRIDVPVTNVVPPPPVHPHAEPPLNPVANQPAVPAPTPAQLRRAECNARLKQADDFEKSDKSQLAREIYPWIVANCPENRTGRIGGRIRLVPAPEPGPSESQ